MTAAEILATFPEVTSDDLVEMEEGSWSSFTATDHEGTLCLISWDDFYGGYAVTDNF